MSASETKVNGNGEIIEGSAVEVYHAPPPPSLFRTDDPVEIIEKATRVANALKGVIVKQHLFKSINGRDHVLVEGWTTLGSMLGVVPVVTWSRRIEPATKYDVEVIHYEWVGKSKREKGRSHYTVEGYDWEARVEARTMDGRTIGGAEAMCSRNESTWAKRDDYALRSMSQTRAVSKALRGPLGFIVALAGYATTPFEEMPVVEVEVTTEVKAPVAALPDVVTKRLLAAIKAVQMPHDWVRMQLVAVGATNVPEGPVMPATIRQLTEDQADRLIAICGAVVTSRAKAQART